VKQNPDTQKYLRYTKTPKSLNSQKPNQRPSGASSTKTAVFIVDLHKEEREQNMDPLNSKLNVDYTPKILLLTNVVNVCKIKYLQINHICKIGFNCAI
jgi:hypothetical protein